MPACRQCGKQNPEGTVFCGYCAASLAGAATPAGTTSAAPRSPVGAQARVLEPEPSAPKHEVKPPPAKVLKPESRLQAARTPPPPPADSKGKGGIEWLPWSELSAGQRAGRASAGVVGLLLIFFFIRGIFRGIAPSNGSASAPQSSEVPMTDGDRKDGIESLCKVFQIYGMPKSEQDASGSAKNAAELFKLAGNQSPERSMFILTTIAGQFRDGTLKASDCAEAGAPIGTAENSDAPNAGPTR
jgi:hypothetical protein